MDEKHAHEVNTKVIKKHSKQECFLTTTWLKKEGDSGEELERPKRAEEEQNKSEESPPLFCLRGRECRKTAARNRNDRQISLSRDARDVVDHCER